MARRPRLHFRDKEGRLGSFDSETRRPTNGTSLHGSRKELGTGLVNRILKDLGLK
jgi:hypothetical protein